jgi:hypothetical protein
MTFSFPTISTFEIGTTYAGRVNVETLTSVAPDMFPIARLVPYQETLRTLDLSDTTRGAPFITWSFGYIYTDMFNALRVICPGASANVIIRSTAEDNTTFGYYSAIMRWPEPDSYEYKGGRGIWQPFNIRFDGVTTYTP